MTAEGGTDTAGSELEQLRRRCSAKWAVYPDDVLPAWVAEMDLPLAEPIREALAEAVASDDTGYAYAAGCGLHEAFADFAGRRLGWEPDPARVISVGDVVNGLAELVQVLAGPGEGVVINPPVYHPFYPLIAERGRRVVEVPLAGGRDLDPEAIEAAFAAGARVLLLCSPHNPTGRIPSRESLAAIASAAARHDAWVLADEIHAPLTLTGAEHVPFLAVSEEARERGIALTSASKAFNLAGLKCAQIAAVSDTAWAKADEVPSIARHPGHLGVLGSLAAFSDPRAERWLDETVAQLASNRALLGEMLDERLSDVSWIPPEAGYLAWLDFSALGLDAEPAPLLLEHGRVALSAGVEFGPGGEGHARLNFGTAPQILTAIVERIEEAVARWR